MGFKIKGLDKLQKNVKELSKHDHVSFAELFNPDFMKANTDFSTLEEMFAQSGFKVDTAEDFKAIPDAEWEVFITARTKFESWLEMQRVAGKAHMDKIVAKTMKKGL